MSRAAQDWQYLFGVWEKFIEANPTATLKRFAEEQNIPYQQIQIAFNRISRKRKAIAINQSKQSTAKQSLFDPVTSGEAKTVVEAVCNERVAIVHAEILTRLYRALKRLEEIQDAEKAIDIKTAQDVKHSVSAVSDLVRTLREIMPFIIELRDRGNLEAIIGKIQAREFDVTHASLELSKMGVNLPDALRIMLAKTPPIVIENHLESPNMDVLDQRAQEALEHVNWQLECFLPKRGQEIIELKQELKDVESFKPQAEKGFKE